VEKVGPPMTTDKPHEIGGAVERVNLERALMGDGLE
jgi:hypothetical protein